MSRDLKTFEKRTYDLEYYKKFSGERINAVALCAEVGLSLYKIHHSLVVADAALLIADEVEKQNNIRVDKQVVEIGALLHDIGISQINKDDMPEHAYIGAEIARDAGYSEEIARCIELHDGGGFGKEFVSVLNIAKSVDKDDLLPESWEEKIVCYADLLISVEAEAGLDVWTDDYSPAKAIYYYVNMAYNTRLGIEVSENHPQFNYVNEFNKEMREYAPKEKYLMLKPQINRMLKSIALAGLELPFPSLKEWHGSCTGQC